MPTFNFADADLPHLPEGEDVKKYEFRSASRPDLVHTVVVDKGGVRCTCEGWKYRQHCKHVDMIPYGREDA